VDDGFVFDTPLVFGILAAVVVVFEVVLLLLDVLGLVLVAAVDDDVFVGRGIGSK
jgi:hypothetical protein